jgi:hypothetical protein
MDEQINMMTKPASNNSMQRTALRAAADAARYTS